MVMNKLLLLNMNVSGCLVGFVQFHVLTFLLPCCDVRVETMISSSLFCKGLMYYCISSSVCVKHVKVSTVCSWYLILYVGSQALDVQ